MPVSSFSLTARFFPSTPLLLRSLLSPLRAFASKPTTAKTAEQEEATKIRRALRALPKVSTEPPKRPLSSYLLFLGDKRSDIAELDEIKRLEKKNRPVAVVKKGGRAKYATLAQTARETYNKALKDYLSKRTPEDLVIQETTRRYQKRLSSRSRAKVLSDPNAPRKPVSGYVMFCTDLHRGVDVEGVKRGAVAELGIGERGRETGRLWRELSKSVKEKYLKASEVDKERYRKELEAYNKKSGMRDAKEAVNEERRQNLKTMTTRRKTTGRRNVVKKKILKQTGKAAVTNKNAKKAVANKGVAKKAGVAHSKKTILKPDGKKKRWFQEW
ncbi:hypothetical protein BC829DRAFT_444810 [Chytridium lagenaria]|nr:hypothetical protein BC829DRAFT_444810 [Chytridium lagenaria]